MQFGLAKGLENFAIWWFNWILKISKFLNLSHFFHIALNDNLRFNCNLIFAYRCTITNNYVHSVSCYCVLVTILVKFLKYDDSGAVLLIWLCIFYLNKASADWSRCFYQKFHQLQRELLLEQWERSQYNLSLHLDISNKTWYVV